MSDPRENDSTDEENAPDEALLGPGSTATGGGTSQDSPTDTGDDDTTIPPLDPDGSGSTQLADERFRNPDL
jgi:hypothetical protein